MSLAVGNDGCRPPPRSGSLNKGFGWRGRTRTFNLLIQSQAPYHLATRQRQPRILAQGPGRARGSTRAERRGDAVRRVTA